VLKNLSSIDLDREGTRAFTALSFAESHQQIVIKTMRSNGISALVLFLAVSTQALDAIWWKKLISRRGVVPALQPVPVHSVRRQTPSTTYALLAELKDFLCYLLLGGDPTRRDGLSDGDEVRVYKTNPTKNLVSRNYCFDSIIQNIGG
jgi:hypothetical protein